MEDSLLLELELMEDSLLLELELMEDSLLLELEELETPPAPIAPTQRGNWLAITFPPQTYRTDLCRVGRFPGRRGHDCKVRHYL